MKLRLEQKLDRLIATAQEQGVDCKRMGTGHNLVEFLDKMLGDRHWGNNGQVYEIQCGKFGTPATFTVSIGVYVYVPSRIRDWPQLPESSSIIVFYVCSHGNVVKGPFPGIDKRITLEKDGRFVLRDKDMQPERDITIEELVLVVKAEMEKPDSWAAVHRDRYN
jgi:hypothetical protein